MTIAPAIALLAFTAFGFGFALCRWNVQRAARDMFEHLSNAARVDHSITVNDWHEAWNHTLGPVLHTNELATVPLAADGTSPSRTALNEAIQKVVLAIINPGRVPAYHREQHARLRNEWSTLALALDDLVTAAHDAGLSKVSDR